jgi:hypothetical protein
MRSLTSCFRSSLMKSLLAMAGLVTKYRLSFPRVSAARGIPSLGCFFFSAPCPARLRERVLQMRSAALGLHLLLHPPPCQKIGEKTGNRDSSHVAANAHENGRGDRQPFGMRRQSDAQIVSESTRHHTTPVMTWSDGGSVMAVSYGHARRRFTSKA